MRKKESPVSFHQCVRQNRKRGEGVCLPRKIILMSPIKERKYRRKLLSSIPSSFLEIKMSTRSLKHDHVKPSCDFSSHSHVLL